MNKKKSYDSISSPKPLLGSSNKMSSLWYLRENNLSQIACALGVLSQKLLLTWLPSRRRVWGVGWVQAQVLSYYSLEREQTFLPWPNLSGTLSSPHWFLTQVFLQIKICVPLNELFSDKLWGERDWICLKTKPSTLDGKLSDPAKTVIAVLENVGDPSLSRVPILHSDVASSKWTALGHGLPIFLRQWERHCWALLQDEKVKKNDHLKYFASRKLHLYCPWVSSTVCCHHVPHVSLALGWRSGERQEKKTKTAESSHLFHVDHHGGSPRS